jgi:integrase
MSIDKRPNGKYRARVRIYPGGPERSKHFALKRDAERWEADVRTSLARGIYLTPAQQKVTLGEYIETHISRHPWWREKSILNARMALGQAESCFGRDRPLYSIRRGDVASYVAILAGRFAPSTARTWFAQFRSLILDARDDGLLIVDPTLRIRKPTYVRHPTPLIIDRGQVDALLARARPPVDLAIVLAFCVGLRAGEVRGLIPSDIDFTRRTITVRRQLDGRRTSRS